MKKVFMIKGKAQTKEVPTPEAMDSWVLVCTRYSFVSSGTERQTLSNQAKNLCSRFFEKLESNAGKIKHALENDGIMSTMYQIKGTAKKALQCGYSCSGVVAWAGPSSGFEKGDFVACAGDGFACHSEFVAVPKNLVVKLSSNKFLKSASCVAIASVAMQGFRQANLKLGETALIFGLGLVGLLTVQIAKAAGCKVIGVDTLEDRLEMAKTFGCDKTFIADDPGLEGAVNFFTDGHGVDSVIVATGGGKDIMSQALRLVRRKGQVVALGTPELSFDREDFFGKEANVVASCSYGPGRYQETFELEGLDYPFEFVRWTEQRNLQLCADMIESGQLKIEPLIQSEFSVDESEQAYKEIQGSSSLGVVISYNALPEEANNFYSDSLPAFAQTDKSKIFGNQSGKFNVAVVGTGGFARTRLIPIILSNKSANLYCLVDSDGSNLVNAGEQFDVTRQFNNFEQALSDPNVDVVVISTPHGLHTDQSIQAMEAGKAVFVEKPPAVNAQQLEKLEAYLTKNPAAFYAVDFNRSSSPFFDKINASTIQRACPLLMEYRVNAGFFSPNHWIYKPENNGRIIGEACHMVEFMMALAGEPVKSLSVGAISKNPDLARDNFSVNLSFKDGSHGTLIYTSLGNQGHEKERFEVFWEGRSVIMEDFKSLKGYGMPFGFSKKYFGPEKGHKQVLSKFFDCLKKGDLKTLYQLRQRALMATKICILVNDLMLEGGGFVNLEQKFDNKAKDSCIEQSL